MMFCSIELANGILNNTVLNKIPFEFRGTLSLKQEILREGWPLSSVFTLTKKSLYNLLLLFIFSSLLIFILMNI